MIIFEEFLMSSAVILLIDNSTGEIAYVNKAAIKFYGYESVEICALNISDINVTTSKGNSYSIASEPRRYQHRLKDQSIREIILYSSSINYNGRKLNCAIIQDVTEEKRLNKIASRVPGVLYQYVLRQDGSSYFPYASEGIREIYGVSPEEVIQDASVVFNRIHKDDLANVVNSIEVSAKSLTPWQYEYRVQDDDGSIRLLYGNAMPQKEENGNTLWHGFITDITIENDTKNSLDEFRLRLNKLFDLHGAIMLIVDPKNGNILDANIAASRFYGYSRTKLQSLNIADINIISKDEIAEEIINASSEKRNYFILKHQIANKEVKTVEVLSTPINIEGKDLLFSVIHDITQRIEIEKKISESTIRLKKINTDLESFAYVASHDLRAPLNLVNGFLKLLLNKKISLSNEQKEEYIIYIQKSIDQMNILITDLLQYSRIGSNKDDFLKVDLNLLLDNIKLALAETIQFHNASVIINQFPSVFVNKTLINELFMNLLNNALKYHDGKKPLKIEVGYSDKGSMHQFYVKDNGIGIASENLEKIFIMFKRLHTQTEFAGTGIGLALCKRIVESHEGKIWVESELDKGSTFYFTIQKMERIV
jgi:PAS domain S-box-containing protein